MPSEWEAHKARFLRAVHDIVLSGSAGNDDSEAETSDSEVDAEDSAIEAASQPTGAVPPGGDEESVPEPAKPELTKSKKARIIPRAQELWVYLREYFETNWFIPDWIRMCFYDVDMRLGLTRRRSGAATFTDIGLPADQTRDGPWNTNNWIERAFRTFDSVFLDNRDNKRCVICA